MKLRLYIAVIMLFLVSSANAQFQGFMFNHVRYHDQKKSWIRVEYDFTVKNIGKERYEILATENKNPHRVVFWVKVKKIRKIRKIHEYLVYSTSINKGQAKYVVSTTDIWKMTYGLPGKMIFINKHGGEQQIEFINEDYD